MLYLVCDFNNKSNMCIVNVYSVCLLWAAESPQGVDKTDQWLGVAVASQATDRGLALVSYRLPSRLFKECKQ